MAGRDGVSGFDRRTMLTVALVGSAAMLVGRTAAASLLPTPAQTTGPFYPVAFPLDADADLLTVEGQAAPAQGTPTHVLGRILDRDGRPVRGARVEIWQCDAFGHYHHPRDGGGADANFQGFGAATASAEGAWRFRTIRPVAYPGRTPHIHFAVFPPGGERFVTQMYVAGESQNETDMVLSRIRDPEARARLIVPLMPADEVEAGALLGRFDIVLGQA